VAFLALLEGPWDSRKLSVLLARALYLEMAD
jgi:hypothetical protein